MRSPRWCRTWLFGIALFGCGSGSESETVTVAQSADVEVEEVADDAPETVVAEPRRGGTVVVAGRYPVEVTPHRSGQVYAYVLGDPPPPDRVELTVQVPVAGRSTGRPVRLTWNPARRRYEGRVRRVEIVEGPLDVVIVVDGAEYRGSVDVYVLFPAVEVQVIEVRGRGKFKRKGKGKHRRRGGVIIVR